MKKSIRLVLFVITLGCSALISCGNDNKTIEPDKPTTPTEVNPLNVFTGGVPLSYGEYNILKNVKGQVSAIQANNGDEKITFEYMKSTSNNANTPNVVMTLESKDEKLVLNLFLNKEGFVKHCDETEYHRDDLSQKETWDFTYNNNGQLLTMFRSEGNERTTIKYEAGNIVSTAEKAVNGTRNKTHKVYYTSQPVPSPIVNKGCIMLFDTTLGIDMDEMQYAYFAGLLGKATKHLPVRLVDNEGEEESFAWHLNASGYPTSMVRSHAPNWTNTFIW
ncbi:MAG: DUF4595 domain-containing protein [Prevotella veroralis]